MGNKSRFLSFLAKALLKSLLTDLVSFLHLRAPLTSGQSSGPQTFLGISLQSGSPPPPSPSFSALSSTAILSTLSISLVSEQTCLGTLMHLLRPPKLRHFSSKTLEQIGMTAAATFRLPSDDSLLSHTVAGLADAMRNLINCELRQHSSFSFSPVSWTVEHVVGPVTSLQSLEITSLQISTSASLSSSRNSMSHSLRKESLQFRTCERTREEKSAFKGLVVARKV